MRLGRSKWFTDMCAELLRRGYQPTTACSGLFAGYSLNRLVVEVRARNALRIISPNGVDALHKQCTVQSALKLIDLAEQKR
jgi:hypothetical protein